MFNGIMEMKKISGCYIGTWVASVCSMYFLEFFFHLTYMNVGLMQYVTKDDGTPFEFTYMVIILALIRVILLAIPLFLVALISSETGRFSILKSSLLAVVFPTFPFLAINLSRYSGPDWLYNFGFIGGSLLPIFLLSALKPDKETVLAAFLFAPLPLLKMTSELVEKGAPADEIFVLWGVVMAVLTVPVVIAYLLRRILDSRKTHALA
jgi:hypothetical protein